MEIVINNDFLEKVFQHHKFKNYKDFEIEQIGYRMYLCNSCIENSKCEKCGCLPFDVLGDKYSCNPKKFSDFLSENEWNEFKIKNNIYIHKS